MSYCINPKCEQRQNQEDSDLCSTCHNPLLIQKQYRLLRPLRKLDERGNTEIFEVDAGGKPKVLKVLQNPKLLRWFEREAQTLRRLQYPGIIPRVEPDGYFIWDLKNGKKLYCLVMEKLEGENLEQWLEKNKSISQAVAIKWLKQLINILDILHKEQLFHRDIKLSNILLKSDAQLALIDFGAVREMTDTYLNKCAKRQEMTAIVSPGYSPLEQVNGKSVAQSDFYALGRCFVHLLTGVHPLDFSEDEQTGKLIWYDSDCKDNIWPANLIEYLIAPLSSKQRFFRLLTDVHPVGFSKDKQTSKSIRRNSDRKVETWLAKLIDDLIEPVKTKRPHDTEEILQRLEIEQAFLQQQRSRQIANLLQLLNIGIFIIWVTTCLFYLHDKNQQWQLDSTKGYPPKPGHVVE